MNVRLHVERLVLDGVTVPRHQQPGLRSALEAELAQRIAEGGLAPDLLTGQALPRVTAGDIQRAAGAEPAQLGRQIARAVYRGIGAAAWTPGEDGR